MADLTPAQRQLANELIRIGQARGASPKEIKAALETAAVEKNFTNTSGGDSDSSNWRQERASGYGGAWAKTGGPLNLEASANRFYDEAHQFNKTGQYGSAGSLAAAVQRPAAQYRGRYQEHSALADSLLGGAVGSSSGGAAGSTSGAGPATSSAPAAPLIGGGGQAGDFTSLLGTLLAGPQQQAPASTPLAPPAFSSALKMPTGALALAPSPQATPSQDRVGAALSLVQALGAQDPTEPQAAAPATADGTAGVPIAQKVMQARAGRGGAIPLGGSKNAGKGAFTIDGPSPDRLKPALVSFADKVAEVAGTALVGKDGSTHSKYTVNGNVSDHYSGQATDIFTIGGKPAVGERLIRAGQAALIAAGMPRAEALKQQGGLYNVNGHQIIFHTSGVANGGDHMDHLHISAH